METVEVYEAPKVEVEKGFATSGDMDPINNGGPY